MTTGGGAARLQPGYSVSRNPFHPIHANEQEGTHLMTSSVSRRGLAFGIGVVLGVVGLLAGCTATPPGDLGRLQTVLAACPDDGKHLNSYNAVDGSSSAQDNTIAREYVSYVKSQVEKVAVCGGHIEVVAFGTNSVIVPIYASDLEVPGATDLAKLRRVPALVDEVMAEITKNYKPAMALLPEGGTDVTGLLRLFEEAAALRPDMRLEVAALTDGLTNQGVVIDHTLTDAEATALADSVPVPQLPSANVSVVGIGRVAGDPLPSDFIAGMKIFYRRLCANTGAAQCLVVTDGR